MLVALRNSRPDAFVGKNGDRDLFADQEAGSEDQSTA